MNLPSRIRIQIFAPLAAAGCLIASDLDFSDPAKLPPHPKDAVGFPSRDANFDALPGFVAPPPGYGEVAFYWWVGEPLTKERMAWQLDKLKDHRIEGLQINYMHSDAPGWPSVPSDPALFTPEWWDLTKWFMQEAKKRGMAVSLSDYTLGIPGHGQWTDEVIAEHPAVRGVTLENIEVPVAAGSTAEVDLLGSKAQIAGTSGGYFKGKKASELKRLEVIGATAYRVANGKVVPGSGVDLRKHVADGKLKWTPPAGSGDWKISATVSILYPVSIDPMNPLSGSGTIEKLFKRFEDRFPGEAGKGLNFFFSDELGFGVRGNLWNDRFAEEFRKRKGYDIVPELPAIFGDIGPRTPKVRLDYYDVIASLSEESYFKPLFQWNYDRGMIYGCDHGGRGRDVTEFGDYFRTQRWNTGPGNDSPHLGSDLIKNKVSSSMAHLYERERVWNEGYYSSGWGTSTANLVDVLYRNMAMGHNLLTLHGLYYTTYGGYWEWAPPCNHFRMPYWDHMKKHLEMSERLSYLLSQGVHRCDVAILYPVAAMEADADVLNSKNAPATTPGRASVATAFGAANYLQKQGVDFDFMDFESLSRAKIADKELKVAGERYRVLVIPAMQALRFETLEKALEFQRAGGIVVALGALPSASDRAGREDPKLDAMVKELFGASAKDVPPAQPLITKSSNGGIGVWAKEPSAIVEAIDRSFPRDVAGVDGAAQPTAFLHRKIGPRDVYMVYGAAKGSTLFFRAHGIPELWDPWTGRTLPLFASKITPEGTQLRMPLTESEAQLIVFNPGRPTATIPSTNLDEITSLTGTGDKTAVQGLAKSAGEKWATVDEGKTSLTLKASVPQVPAVVQLDGLWDFELVPTMDNRFGDFRLPATNTLIGAEARHFRYADESAPNPGWEKPDFDDSQWPKVTNSFGPQFWKLGPLPEALPAEAEAALAALQAVDPSKPVQIGGKEYRWQPYDFSWRWGKEGDPGHQGYHGLKKNITDEFLCLGAPTPGMNETKYVKEPQGSKYYLWTSAAPAKDTKAEIDAYGLTPAAIYINGQQVPAGPAGVQLKAGANPMLVRYDSPGRGHIVLVDKAASGNSTEFPLAMRWFTQPGVIPFDVRPQDANPAGWYRFVAPPGLRSMTVPVRGTLMAWANGKALEVGKPEVLASGLRKYTVPVDGAGGEPVTVALRIAQDRGFCGGAAIPDPITLECGTGKMAAGDWAKTGAMECYSGGARYSKTISVTQEQLAGRVVLNLGGVASSAEVVVNGKPAGIRIAPPWTFDLTSLLKAGENRVEVLVYNTLANHYVTIPTKYRGSTVSGLLGPVTIETAVPVTLKK